MSRLENVSLILSKAAGSCGKHVQMCFAEFAYSWLWLWQSQHQKHPVWFISSAFAFGKPPKAETKRP
jgi:hypothetical protein